MSGLLKKRSHEDETPLDSVKRFHGETEKQVLYLLEEIESADKLQAEQKSGPSEEVVSGVMKSLEEEIGITSCSTSYEGSPGLSKDDDSGESAMAGYGTTEGGIDLDYLLGASDDELGITPNPVINLEGQAGFGVSFDFAKNEDLKGFADNWHFEDDLTDYSQFSSFEDAPASAWDVVSPGPFVRGDYSEAWVLESADDIY